MELPNFNIQNTVKENNNNILKKDINTIALLSSLKNTQNAMTLINNLSKSLSVITEKYIDSLAISSESNEAMENISDLVNDSYSDDLELKTLIEKAMTNTSSSQHIKYIKSLQDLSALSYLVSSGIKDYDGDVDIYYAFNEKLNSLGLM